MKNLNVKLEDQVYLQGLINGTNLVICFSDEFKKFIVYTGLEEFTCYDTLKEAIEKFSSYNPTSILDGTGSFVANESNELNKSLNLDKLTSKRCRTKVNL